MKKYATMFLFSFALTQFAQAQLDDSRHWVASSHPKAGVHSSTNEGEGQIVVRPNEQTKQLTVSLPSAWDVSQGWRVQMMDVHGIVLKNQRLATSSVVLEIGDLPLGAYTVRVQSGKILHEETIYIHRSHNL